MVLLHYSINACYPSLLYIYRRASERSMIEAFSTYES